jgi:bifunctional DNA-binding transcriptional regulator/antitoxin component of YhaV-PrlF toxin-antitoxin module
MPTLAVSKTTSARKSPRKTLSVTTRGQVTFRKDVLQHLGITPGGKLEVEILPNGCVQLHAAKQVGSIRDAYGILAGKTSKVATIEEIKRAAEDGWAGLVR